MADGQPVRMPNFRKVSRAQQTASARPSTHHHARSSRPLQAPTSSLGSMRGGNINSNTPAASAQVSQSEAMWNAQLAHSQVPTTSWSSMRRQNLNTPTAPSQVARSAANWDSQVVHSPIPPLPSSSLRSAEVINSQVAPAQVTRSADMWNSQPANSQAPPPSLSSIHSADINLGAPAASSVAAQSAPMWGGGEDLWDEPVQPLGPRWVDYVEKKQEKKRENRVKKKQRAQEWHQISLNNQRAANAVSNRQSDRGRGGGRGGNHAIQPVREGYISRNERDYRNLGHTAQDLQDAGFQTTIDSEGCIRAWNPDFVPTKSYSPQRFDGKETREVGGYHFKDFSDDASPPSPLLKLAVNQQPIVAESHVWTRDEEKEFEEAEKERERQRVDAGSKLIEKEHSSSEDMLRATGILDCVHNPTEEIRNIIRTDNMPRWRERSESPLMLPSSPPMQDIAIQAATQNLSFVIHEVAKISPLGEVLVPTPQHPPAPKAKKRINFADIEVVDMSGPRERSSTPFNADVDLTQMTPSPLKVSERHIGESRKTRRIGESEDEDRSSPSIIDLTTPSPQKPKKDNGKSREKHLQELYGLTPAEKRKGFHGQHVTSSPKQDDNPNKKRITDEMAEKTMKAFAPPKFGRISSLSSNKTAVAKEQQLPVSPLSPNAHKPWPTSIPSARMTEANLSRLKNAPQVQVVQGIPDIPVGVAIAASWVREQAVQQVSAQQQPAQQQPMGQPSQRSRSSSASTYWTNGSW